MTCNKERTKENIMRPIKDYSIARLALVGFGGGIIIGALRIAVRETFPASAWTILLSGVVGGIVFVAMFVYLGKVGRDKQLLRKDARH